jgi:hypothetical protein
MGKGEEARREDVRCGSRDCEGEESELHFWNCVCVCVWRMCV